MLSKIKNFFIAVYQGIIEARELKAKTYADYYKKTGRLPNWTE